MSSINTNGGTLSFRYTTEVEYQVNSGSWNTVTAWPVTIDNSSSSAVTKVLFTTDITLVAPSQYFICGSPRIQFGSENLNTDAGLYIINIDTSSDNYPGLIQNGDDTTAGKSNIYIYNLLIQKPQIPNGLASAGGWIAQQYFAHGASNCYILNCQLFAPIPDGCGGIVGQYAAHNGGNLTIRGCSSDGDIGQNGGGIVGRFAADESGTVTIEYCYSAGNIGTDAGGIVGANACSGSLTLTGGTLNVTNCYSIGSISGGGIVGQACANPSSALAYVFNCYSSGNIAGDSGGIIGRESGGSKGTTGNVVISNCYTTGDIANGAGGIYGSDSSIYRNVNHCYTTGSQATTGSGIFTSGGDPSGCKSEDGSGWNDGNAFNTLTGADGGDWIQPNGLNTPYKLAKFGYTPYSTSIINTTTNQLIDENIYTLNPGDSTLGIIDPGKYGTPIIVTVVPPEPSITIDTSTGIVSTTENTPGGSYILVVYYPDNLNSYVITNIELIVSGGPTPPVQDAQTPTLTELVKGSLGVTCETFTELKGAFTVTATQPQKQLRFTSFDQYTRYKKAIARRIR